MPFLEKPLPAFRFVHARRPAAGVLQLHWAIEPTAIPLENIRYEIFRSNGAAGPWDLLALPEPGRYDFYDFETRSAATVRAYYYIVRMARTDGSAYQDSEVFTLHHDADAISLEMVRKKTLFLRVKGGIGTAVLARKFWGARCGRCWNQERMAPTDPDCPECFGVGFVGGYLLPVFLPALANPPKRAVIDSGIPYEIGNTYFELANFPVVNMKDIFVDTTMNLRYEVEAVGTTSHRMHPISQMIQVNRIDENSIVYTIPCKMPPHEDVHRSWDFQVG